ncbi:aa3-type cytochrome c oxidase subunit IV [Arenibaculum pallidiluteum]|nr:aa3-type cytochrome c oxidase subunit IV [Arenibaculum pallidiluteum]
MATTDDQQPIWRDAQYNEHVAFYDRFMKVSQYGVVAVIAVLVLMAIFLL